jgi:hypothetical protein
VLADSAGGVPINKLTISRHMPVIPMFLCRLTSCAQNQSRSRNPIWTPVKITKLRRHRGLMEIVRALKWITISISWQEEDIQV